MELDDIKKILNTEVPTETISSDTFKKVKSRKSLHPAEKIKRKILVENLLSLVIAVVIIIYLVTYKSTSTSLLDFIIITIVLLSLVYGFGKVFQLQRLLNYSGNTKEFLLNFNKAIKGYIRVLTISALILIPVGMYIGYTIGYSIGSKLGYTEVINKFFENPSELIIITGVSIVCTIGGFYLIKLIYQAIYGKNIKEIEQLIHEIE